MKRYIGSACFYIVVLACLGVILASVWNFPGACRSEFPDKRTVIYPGGTTMPEPVPLNARMDEHGAYKPVDEDPGLVFTLDHPYDIQSIGMTFGAPTEADINLALYYAEEGEEFSSRKVKRTAIPQNAGAFYCDLDARNCRSLRVGIDGAVDIESICLSPDGIIYTIEKSNWFVAPLTALIVLVIAVTLRVIERIKRSKTTAAPTPEGPVSHKPYVVGFLAFYIAAFLILYSLGHQGCLHRIDEMMTRSRFLKKTVIEWVQSANHHS